MQTKKENLSILHPRVLKANEEETPRKAYCSGRWLLFLGLLLCLGRGERGGLLGCTRTGKSVVVIDK
jgi:hypothetical protein